MQPRLLTQGKSRDGTRRHSPLEGVRTTGDERHTSAHSVRNTTNGRAEREHRADGSHASGCSVASSPSTRTLPPQHGTGQVRSRERKCSQVLLQPAAGRP